MNRKAILLVEDNEGDAKLTIRALQKNNVANDVELVSDGVEALDYIFARGAYADRKDKPLPSVVLLDLKLPKVDGMAVLRQVRADARTRFLPVVILTSSKEEQDLIDGYSLGCNAYVRKPVDFVQFNEAIVHLGLFWLVVNEPPPHP